MRIELLMRNIYHQAVVQMSSIFYKLQLSRCWPFSMITAAIWGKYFFRRVKIFHLKNELYD